MIQEYVQLLCRFEAINMLDNERFCLPKFSRRGALGLLETTKP